MPGASTGHGTASFVPPDNPKALLRRLAQAPVFWCRRSRTDVLFRPRAIESILASAMPIYHRVYRPGELPFITTSTSGGSTMGRMRPLSAWTGGVERRVSRFQRLCGFPLVQPSGYGQEALTRNGCLSNKEPQSLKDIHSMLLASCSRSIVTRLELGKARGAGSAQRSTPQFRADVAR